MIAACRRNENVVKYLESVGANLEQVNRNDENIMHLCAQYNSHKIIEVNFFKLL